MNSLAIAILFAVVIAAPGARGQLASALDLNERGNDAASAGRSDEAIALYRDSIAIWSASGPKYDGHRAGTLLNLAIVVSLTGNRPEAVKILQESLVLHRQVLGPRHLRTITNMNLLASNLQVLGRTEEADALFRDVLPIARELYPADIQTARALEGISNVLMRQGRASEAAAPAEEALAIAIKASGTDSLDSALAYANVAEMHRANHHPERALPLFRKSRVMYEKVLGPDHPRVASLLSQEGLLLMDEGKLATAEQFMTQALAALDRSCPKCMVERAIAENNLAVLRIKQKRYGDADQLLSHVVSLREGFTSTPGEELAGALRLLAAVRQKEQLFDDAERLTRRANVIMGYR
jgi:tetratricopeptide (TPR) repeat protein